MAESPENFDSLSQRSPVQLSAKQLHAKRFHSHSSHDQKKKPPLREQVSKTPKNAVKLKQAAIPVHFTWALILTISCFFLIGPIWTLYKTIQLRRMIERREVDAAARLSHKITTVLTILTVLGAFAWVAILFCTVGLILTGVLLQKKLI
ncbi:unnamed protein product [Adineta ricciae]|nr:unnamed protein product [Adineta ricciae]